MTPMPSRTASESPRKTQSRRPSRSPLDTQPPTSTPFEPSRASFAELIVILAACAIGIIMIIVFMAQSCRRRPDGAAQLKSGRGESFGDEKEAIAVSGTE
jgi:hypothetical protein